jgi:hypothetical protein
VSRTYGVEPFDVGYGASFAAQAESPFDLDCPIVEDQAVFTAHTPARAELPQRLAFVDGTMTTEARLTRRESDGTLAAGIAGAWAAGSVLASAGQPLRLDGVCFGRVTVCGGGVPIVPPAQPGGWAWEALAVEAGDVEVARQRLQRRMREAEGALAERLCDEGWLTVVDGPLNNVRRTRGVPIVGYVKTHHRRMLAADGWANVPELRVGQRSSAFVIGADLYGCYARVGDAGPWASAWSGIVRLEVPSGAGRAAAVEAMDQAAAWLPRFASAPHRDPRAPVNLTPIAGLERALRRHTGHPGLALRAIRAAVLQLNASHTAATTRPLGVVHD